MVGVKAEPAPPPGGAITRRRAAVAYAANTTMTRRRSAGLAAKLNGPPAAVAVKAEPPPPAAAAKRTPKRPAVKAEPPAAAAPAKRGAAAKRGAPTKAAAAATATQRGKRKARGPPAPAVAAAGGGRGKRTRRGLAGTRAPATGAGALGIVDPRSGVDGAICVDEDGIVYDVTLNLRDAATNADKYYILQLIGATDGRYVVFSHYGRTGTAGQCLAEEFVPADPAGAAPDDEGGDAEAGLVAALDAFGAKFAEKTGLAFDAAAAAGAAPPIKGKYRVVVVDHGARAAAAAAGASATPRWQYWVDDGVDGKSVGWYDYDAAGAAVTESLYVEWGLNAWLTERVVASGAWTYLVDLSAMCQTNLEHYAHTRRRIRRVPPGVVPDKKPPV